MSSHWWITAAVLLMLAPIPLRAADRPPPFLDPQTAEQWGRAETLARRGIDELLRSLKLFQDSLPRYGAPFLDENGNIVIPRQHRTAPPGVPVPAPDRA